MAQQQPDLTGRRAGLWKLEEWARRGQAATGSGRLAPTAGNTANFGIYASLGNTAWVTDVLFSTDTAIGWRLFPWLGNFLLPAGALVTLGPQGTFITGVTFGAVTGGPLAPTPVYASGFAPAGFCGSLIGRMKIFVTAGFSVVLQTDVAALNCACTFIVIGAAQ